MTEFTPVGQSEVSARIKKGIWQRIHEGDLYNAYCTTAISHWPRLTVQDQDDFFGIIHSKAHSGRFSDGPLVAYEISQHMVTIHRPSDPRDQERRSRWGQKYREDMVWYAEDLERRGEDAQGKIRNLAEHFNWQDYLDENGQMRGDVPGVVQRLARTAINIEISCAPNYRLYGGLYRALSLARETGVPGGVDTVFNTSDEAEYELNRWLWEVNKSLEGRGVPLRLPLIMVTA